MINFVNTQSNIKAYFINPLTEEKRWIGSCELFVGEEAIAYWKNAIKKGYYGQVSELLALVAKIESRSSVI